MELDRDVNGGASQKEHWEKAAAHGNPDAIAKLRPPANPPLDAFYLWRWAIQLHGRSGITPVGTAAPLAPSEVMAYAVLSGRMPDSLEFEALMRLDAVLRGTPNHNEATEDAHDEPEPVVDRWPKKPNG